METKDRKGSLLMSSASDGLNLASKMIPCKEYVLQGSIMDSAVEVLLHRLRGLCDNVDSGPETFHDHEFCFSIRGTNSQSMLLRVRRALDCPQDMPYQLRYIGDSDIGAGDKTRPTIVRSSIDVAITPTVLDFLTELGCRLEFEYMTRGYMFRKGRIKIIVSKIFKTQGQNKEAIEFISQSYLVEMSVLAPTSGHDSISEDMRSFAEQLKPLVHLDKIDYKRLPQQHGLI